MIDAAIRLSHLSICTLHSAVLLCLDGSMKKISGVVFFEHCTSFQGARTHLTVLFWCKKCIQICLLLYSFFFRA
uniref:Uncharacterized protein n=1 Tax=Nelumbo nucifera TaxID=4432 RepID=A0A822YZW1_NELNU|nr:TPA_asm: hypothetical protein HUJ06_007632 [Nelumbo nucifera]